MRTGLPRVIVKIAASLDGRVALANGESRWITGDAARADVQRLRAEVERGADGHRYAYRRRSAARRCGIRRIDTLGRQPLRVVLDSRLRMPATARMLATAGRDARVHVSDDVRARDARSSAARRSLGVSRGTGGRVDLAQVLRELGRSAVQRRAGRGGPDAGGPFHATGSGG